MKKATITITFDEEKVAALKLYLEQKGTQVETELEKAVEILYTKSVPSGVREFIDLRSGNAPKNPVSKSKKVKGQDVNVQEQKSKIQAKSEM